MKTETNSAQPRANFVTAPAADLVNQFWTARPEALFPQYVVAAVLNRSTSWCERSRWDGSGPRFLKMGRAVAYRKGDVILWIEEHQPITSTSEYKRAIAA